jgi:hypothetical protein
LVRDGRAELVGDVPDKAALPPHLAHDLGGHAVHGQRKPPDFVLTRQSETQPFGVAARDVFPGGDALGGLGQRGDGPGEVQDEGPPP